MSTSSKTLLTTQLTSKTFFLVFLFLLTHPRSSQALSPLAAVGVVQGGVNVSNRGQQQLCVRGGGSFSSSSSSFSSRPKKLSSTVLKESISNAVDVDACFEEARSSVRLCARNSLFSFLVDALTDLPSLMEDMPWSERILSLASAAWKLNLAFSLYQFSVARFETLAEKKNGGGPNDKNSMSIENLPDLVDTNYRYLARMWRQTAFILVAETVAELTGVLHGRFPWMQRAFIGFALISIFTFQIASVREFQAFTSNNKKSQQLSPETRRKARITFRNFAMCAGSMFARAAVTPVIAFSQPKKVKILIGLVNFRSRCKVAYYLMQLRRAVMGGFAAAVEEQVTPTIRAELHQSQSRFFDKVGEVLHSEAIIKVIVTLVHMALMSRHGQGLITFFSKSS